VDDNPRNLAILRKLLAGEFNLLTASTGEEALQVAPAFRPDLVLLDIMMPGINGYETCRRLRQCRELAGTKIIIVSAKAMTSERLEGYAAGADDYMTKPFDPDEMLAKARVYARLKSMEEMDRLKSDLLSLLSHETGTPLTNMLGPLMLLKEMPLADEQRRLAEMAESGARRLHRMIEKILLLAQLKADAIEFRPAVEPLERVARAAVENLREKAEETGVSMEVAAEPDVTAEIDADHLRQAVEALLDNAIRFSPSGGRVVLRVFTTETGAAMNVADGGPGISAEVLPRLFEAFVVDDIRHHSKGCGLSLATVRTIVERLGGRVSVTSEPGAGALFRIDLPHRVERAAA
jgi:two-component system, sensor histidine kinase and response regulator